MASMKPEELQLLREVGLDPTIVEGLEVVSDRHGHSLWRVATVERQYVLKWLPDAAGAVEVRGYWLLQELGVPTLPLYGSSPQALLLEDLTGSAGWRLATPGDVARPEAGRAVARWYRIFHDAGEALLSRGRTPDFLTRETDALEPDTIIATGRALGLESRPVWRLAADHIQSLRDAIETLSVTLNYNDFHWTNLALSRGEDAEPEAIVFDYHLLGIGMRYSDWRNVLASLSGEAVTAFRQAYGPVDSREAVLDGPLATLYGLWVATRRATFPRWAEPSRARVVSGDLRRDLIEAIALAESLVS